MWLVYYIAMSTVGAACTDWTNDNLFGDGFHLFGIGSAKYEEVSGEYDDAFAVINGYVEYLGEEGEDVDDIAAAIDSEADDYDAAAAKTAIENLVSMSKNYKEATYLVEDEETLATEDVEATGADLADAVDAFVKYNCADPDPADYGVWVPGIPVLIGDAIEGTPDWLLSLIHI